MPYYTAPLPLLRLFLVIIIVLSCLSISISFSWRAVLAVACLAATYIFPNLSRKDRNNTHDENPYKGKKGDGFITEEAETKMKSLVADLVLYDASCVPSLNRFNKIKRNTECSFAKRSKLWGSLDYDHNISLESNTERLVPTFHMFTLAFQELGLDAFLVELPAELFGSDIETFSSAVRRVLVTLRQADIRRQTQQLRKQAPGMDPVDVENRMRYLTPENTSIWDRRSWVFEFNKITFFLTSFAPFYPESNSRYGFETQHCYILFQPEISFAIHDLPPDTADTNWSHPVTVRDKIRVAFRDAGREYQAPMAARLPMVYDIVKPVDPYDTPLEWWKVSS
ncbi:hypothetical protein EGW08_013576 [Elysia chlorotica]|uniref:Uncharacterized protein n=1 Tax=Elysia chlorotica TaxID=188477 RepID=A0A433TAQ3_ELYCH|nr:hypothetical protein EGW08_013576 [Elysia chlorotica]